MSEKTKKKPRKKTKRRTTQNPRCFRPSRGIWPPFLFLFSYDVLTLKYHKRTLPFPWKRVAIFLPKTLNRRRSINLLLLRLKNVLTSIKDDAKKKKKKKKVDSRIFFCCNKCGKISSFCKMRTWMSALEWHWTTKIVAISRELKKGREDRWSLSMPTVPRFARSNPRKMRGWCILTSVRKNQVHFLRRKMCK